MENSTSLNPIILTPLNYLYWSTYMQISLHNKGLYRMTMGKVTEPHQYIDELKHLDRPDESFCYMCIHVSRELLFHLYGLKTPKEVWDKLESLFGKQDELRDHILENELIALYPGNFDTIQLFFTKLKSMVMECKQCGIKKKE